MAAKYYQVPGPSGDYYEATGFSHAVVLPVDCQLVIAAGQPGLSATARLSSSAVEQIESAFDNCDSALKCAGVKEGLWKAHKIHTWLTDVSNEPLMMEIWRRKWPGHRPTVCGMTLTWHTEVRSHEDPSLWPNVNDPAVEHPFSNRIYQIIDSYRQLYNRNRQDQPLVKLAAFRSIKEVVAAAEMGCHSCNVSAQMLKELAETPYVANIDPGEHQGKPAPQGFY